MTYLLITKDRHLIQVPKGLIYINIMFIILLLLLITYNISGILTVLQLIIAIINIFIINIILGFNPESYFLRFIRICSFIYIIVIIFNNLIYLKQKTKKQKKKK